MRKYILVFVFAFCFLSACGQSLSQTESLSASCVKDLQSSLVSQRSLELTGDITFESYLFTDDVSSREDADYDELTVDGNSAYREYIVIPYAASNAMGVMLDDVAYYKVKRNEDGSSSSYKYIGNNDDYNDWENVKDHKDISLFHMDRDVDSPASSETISANKIAQEVGCAVHN